MNTEKLTGKVIVITGAASGMGAATVSYTHLTLPTIRLV